MTARLPLTLAAGLALTTVFLAAALLSLVWTPHAVETLNIAARLQPASADHLLGTDHFGRDMLSMLMVGALAVWTQEFILAARVSGKGAVRISLEHILPNIASLLIVQGTIQFSLGILAEAGLSYVGLGAQPPLPSWGRMLADSQTMISFAPHLAVLPGLAIIATVLGLNLTGDGLRDHLDPRLRRRQ